MKEWRGGEEETAGDSWTLVADDGVSSEHRLKVEIRCNLWGGGSATSPGADRRVDQLFTSVALSSSMGHGRRAFWRIEDSYLHHWICSFPCFGTAG